MRINWTKNQINFIKENYGTLSKEEFEDKLQLEWKYIVRKANRYGLTRNKWSDAEVALLTKYYTRKPMRFMENLLQKNSSTISWKAKQLNLSSPCFWSAEEEKYLKKYYANTTRKELAKKLNRTPASIEHKVSRMGLKKRKESQLEIDFSITLNELNIPYKRQEKIGRYRVDFLLENNIIIETYGTFWHADPKVYNNESLYEKQKDSIAKDIRRTKFLNSKGYSLIIVWEDDFYNSKSQLIAALQRNLQCKNRAKSVELLRQDNTEVTDLVISTVEHSG